MLTGFQLVEGILADHAAVGDDAEGRYAKAFGEPLDDGLQCGDVRDVSRLYRVADRPSPAIQDGPTTICGRSDLLSLLCPRLPKSWPWHYAKRNLSFFTLARIRA